MTVERSFIKNQKDDTEFTPAIKKLLLIINMTIGIV